MHLVVSESPRLFPFRAFSLQFWTLFSLILFISLMFVEIVIFFSPLTRENTSRSHLRMKLNIAVGRAEVIHYDVRVCHPDLPDSHRSLGRRWRIARLTADVPVRLPLLPRNIQQIDVIIHSYHHHQHQPGQLIHSKLLRITFICLPAHDCAFYLNRTFKYVRQVEVVN